LCKTLVFQFRSTFHKLFETAEIISHLAKNTKSSSAKIKIKKPIQQQHEFVKAQKFKTSSIVVATAVAQSRKYKRSAQPTQIISTTPPSSLRNEQQQQISASRVAK